METEENIKMSDKKAAGKYEPSVKGPLRLNCLCAVNSERIKQQKLKGHRWPPKISLSADLSRARRRRWIFTHSAAPPSVSVVTQNPDYLRIVNSEPGSADMQSSINLLLTSEDAESFVLQS